MKEYEEESALLKEYVEYSNNVISIIKAYPAYKKEIKRTIFPFCIYLIIAIVWLFVFPTVTGGFLRESFVFLFTFIPCLAIIVLAAFKRIFSLQKINAFWLADKMKMDKKFVEAYSVIKEYREIITKAKELLPS